MLCQLELLTLFSVSTRAADLPAPYSLCNFAFFVYGVGAALRTEFFDRKLVGLRLLVLGGRVVARLAGVTRKRNQISHYNTPRKKLLAFEKLSASGAGRRAARSDVQTWKAHDGIRTRDLFLTKEVLYRLSYMGILR
jgi:hypothetical protein